MMTRLAARYPGYGWEHNQGYATRDHRDAIRAMGLTPFHRRSFLALQRTLAGDQLAFDLLGDPGASAELHERLEREAVPVMADDAMLDAPDLLRLDLLDPFDELEVAAQGVDGLEGLDAGTLLEVAPV
jgi:hypothetical protein